MRDDDELRALTQVLEDREQAAEVGVVEGGLDLVHDVERARPRLEDRDEQGDGGERALPSAEEREALDLLARRLDAHLDAGREQVLRIGELDAAGAPGEQDREDDIEGGPGVLERRREDVLHLLVDLLDDREQVPARVREVGELLGEEPVPLLERLELLERERIHPAELGELAFGTGEPLLLRRADVRTHHDLGLLGGHRGEARRRGELVLLRLGCEGVVGHALVGAVLGDEHVLDEPDLAAGALQQRREVQLRLVELHLEAVHVLADHVQAFAQRGLLAPKSREVLVLLGSLRLAGGELDARLRHRAVDRVEYRGQGLEYRLGGGDLAAADDGPPRGLLGLGPLGLELALEGIRSLLLGANPLAHSLDLQPGLDLALPAGLEFVEQGVARGNVENRAGARPRLLEVVPGPFSGCRGVRDGLGRLHEGALEPLGLGARRLGLHPRAVEPLGVGGELRVELAQGGEGLRRLRPCTGEGLALLGEREPPPLDERGHLGEPVGRGVAVGDELEARALGTGSAAQHEWSEHVSGERDDGDARPVGQGGPYRTGSVEVVGDHDAREKSEHSARRGDDAVGGDGTVGWVGLVGDIRPCIGEEELDAAEVARLGVIEGRDGRVAVVGEHRVGEGAERGGDGGLVAGLDLHLLGEEAANPVEPGRDEGARAVLLVEGEGECGGAGGERVALAFEGVQAVAHEVDVRVGGDHLGLCALVFGIEVRLADVDRFGLGLDEDERVAGGVPADDGRIEGILLAQHLAAHGGEAGSRRLGLPGELGDLEVMAGDEGALGGDVLVEAIEVRANERGRLPCGGPLRLRDGHVLTQPVGLVPGIGDGAGRDPGDLLGRLGLLAEERQPLVRERVEAAEPRLFRLEAERDPARDVHGVTDLRLLDALLPQPDLVELLLQNDALGLALALATALQGDRGAQGDDVVRKDAGAGVAHDARDGLGLSRDLCLAPERLELASDLAGEVAQPGEVDLHRVELAHRLLLAAAVLEDPGGLLDESAALLRARAQYGVELPLAHDDVHLAPEAGVAEELLHVEQPAALPVDRVLAAAAAEQGAADRDL